MCLGFELGFVWRVVEGRATCVFTTATFFAVAVGVADGRATTAVAAFTVTRAGAAVGRTTGAACGAAITTRTAGCDAGVLPVAPVAPLGPEAPVAPVAAGVVPSAWSNE